VWKNKGHLRVWDAGPPAGRWAFDGAVLPGKGPEVDILSDQENFTVHFLRYREAFSDFWQVVCVVCQPAQ